MLTFNKQPWRQTILPLVAAGLIFTFGFAFGKEQKSLDRDIAISSRSVTAEDIQAMLANAPDEVVSNGQLNLKLFWEIWSNIKAKYIKSDASGDIKSDVSDEQLFYGALSGMVSSLKDPYSVFFDPQLTKQFSDDLAGEFEGVGMEIGIKQDRLTVVSPLPNSPAQRAGLKAGDKIFAIDGKDTTSILLEQAVKSIRGPKGSKVKLLVLSIGTQTPREVQITRERITVKSVTWQWDAYNPQIAVVKITQFNDSTMSSLRTAIPKILAKKPVGLILDVRNDPGGYLETAVEVASLWIKQGVVVSQRSRNEQDKIDHQATGGAKFENIPTVVLVNLGSASASEIVAGALQDYGLAKIVGEKTYGKGSVQDYKQLTDGSSLKLTVALWFTPQGRSINEQGIAPDVEVKLSNEDYNLDRDPQYAKAIELLGGKQKPGTVKSKPAPALKRK